MHFLKFSIPTLKTNFTRSELKNFHLKINFIHHKIVSQQNLTNKLTS